MKTLDKIEKELVDIEYTLQCLSSRLDNLDEFYEYKKEEEAKKTVWLFKELTDSILEKLSQSISDIEEVLMK